LVRQLATVGGVPRTWRRLLVVLLAVAATTAAWGVFVVANLETRYQVTGSLVLVGHPLAAALDPQAASSPAEVVRADAGDLASRLAEEAVGGDADERVTVEPLGPDLLRVEFRASNSQIAGETLRGLVREALGQGRPEQDPVLLFESTELAKDGERHKAGALLGIPSPSSTWAAVARPPAPYLARVAGAQLDQDPNVGELLGEQGEIHLTQTPYDSAPVVALTVIGDDPYDTLRAYDEVSEQLNSRIADLQTAHGVPSSLQLQAIALDEPAAAAILWETLLPPFFHTTSALFLLMGLAACGLERLARGGEGEG
jgi:hypothetical protein